MPIDTPHKHAMRVIRQRFMKTTPVCIQAPALRVLALAAFRATIFKLSSRLPIVSWEGETGLKHIEKEVDHVMAEPCRDRSHDPGPWYS